VARVTAIIRGFDTLRYYLWRKFGRLGSTPSSFERVVNALANDTPADLRQELIEVSAGTYTRVKAYRDCIQHYVDIGSSSWAMFDLIEDAVWSLIVRVPDNPDARSANSWVFEKDVDALTFGWEAATDFFSACATAFGRASLAGVAANDS